MAETFLAEIRIFPGNFAPTGWAFCNGQILPISQNTALFSLVGTYYGGDGKSNFALPDLQGSAPMHWGQGPGLSARDLGEFSGSETVTLLVSEIPAHTHALQAVAESANAQIPTIVTSLARSSGGSAYSPTDTGLQNMAPQAVGFAGANFPHNNLQPYLTLNFCIALQGIFPPRT